MPKMELFFRTTIGNSASMSSLRDVGFQNVPTPTYTTTMPRGPFLQRHFSGISPHDVQNNNNEPPPIRPRKPPRLIHYAQGTLTRNNISPLGKTMHGNDDVFEIL